jgi:hypothetical protein
VSLVTIWCELVCYTCATPSPGMHVRGRIPRRLLVREARRHGWLFKHDENFCSENCLEHYERRRREEAPDASPDANPTDRPA